MKNKMNNKTKNQTKNKTLYLGSDHAGFELKEDIKDWLKKKHILYFDLGNKIFDPKDDYPDFAKEVAQAVVKNKSQGLLFCGSAEGMCIAANKIKGVRAVAPCSETTTKLSREHNDANILCLAGGGTLKPIPSVSHNQAKKMVRLFLNTPFSGAPRHLRRINKIKELEKLK